MVLVTSFPCFLLSASTWEVASNPKRFFTTGQRRMIEKLWRDFFSDPSQWWDHRTEKFNARYPDFKHKTTQESLWLNSKMNPKWVEVELAAMTPGTVQSNIFSWNNRLLRYVKAGQYEKTMELFRQLLQEGMSPDEFTYVSVLNACAGLQALDEGRSIHTQIKQGCYEVNMYVASSLVDMYIKCGSIQDARAVFNSMPVRNVVSWNIIILGYCRCGLGQEALQLYSRMQEEPVQPDPTTFVGVLNACARARALEEGRAVHGHIMQQGCESDPFIVSSLIDMYAKCGSIEDAQIVFEKIPLQDVVSWNAMIAGYVKCREEKKAIELFRKMKLEGVDADPFTFVSLLNACASLVTMEEGRSVHDQIILRGYESDVFVGSSLVDMYFKCGSIDDACRVFHRMPRRNVVAWSAMILGHVKCGQAEKALRLFEQMQLEGVKPNSVTFVGALNACASIEALGDGKAIHEWIIRSGCESDVFVSNSLIDMYIKCGRIKNAWLVFNKMAVCDVVAWNAMIMGYVKYGQGDTAVKLFGQMQSEGVEPDSITFVGLLNACASLRALGQGRCVHNQILQRGYGVDVIVSNSLVDMYAKCGSMKDAEEVFQEMPIHDIVSWNALIVGYAKCGQGQRALELLVQMQKEGVQPNNVTFMGLLKGCASRAALEDGRRVHENIIQGGCKVDVHIENSLLSMYSRCGSIEEARAVFNFMPVRDDVSWTAMIVGYMKCGQGHLALELFGEMQLQGVEPNPATFASVLSACAAVRAVEQGRCIHKEIIWTGWENNILICNSLVDMYIKCGSLEDAWAVFNKMPRRDAVAWSAMLLGLVNSSQGKRALELFNRMQQEGIEPDAVIFVGVLNACASLAGLEEGKCVHRQISQRGYEADTFVSNSLIDMYAKCGSIEDAWRVFNKMTRRDVVAWTGMILGYVKCGQGQKALELFCGMEQEGVEPDNVTFVGVLNACASLEALEEGRRVHEQIIERGYQYDIFVCSCLVDMYAKCGSVEDAWTVFIEMPVRDVVSWNTMLSGYAMHGHFKEALGCFELMCQQSLEVDRATFVSLLSACSHAGLVDEGFHYFESMNSVYNISSTVEHYACMVDLLARAGRLQEAEDVVKSMSYKTSASAWMSLLSGCRVHGNVEMGERIALHVLELDPKTTAGHLLLSNIYAAAGLLDSGAKVRAIELGNGC